MEPITITTLTHIVASFFGYYIGTNLYDTIKMRTEFDKVNARLDTIINKIERKNY